MPDYHRTERVYGTTEAAGEDGQQQQQQKHSSILAVASAFFVCPSHTATSHLPLPSATASNVLLHPIHSLCSYSPLHGEG